MLEERRYEKCEGGKKRGTETWKAIGVQRMKLDLAAYRLTANLGSEPTSPVLHACESLEKGK